MEYAVTEGEGRGIREAVPNLQKIMANALQLRLKALKGKMGKIPRKKADWRELREYLDEYRDIRGL